MHPYRTANRTAESEEDLWLRLDWALEEVFRDPHWAWSIAWQVARDAGRRYPDVGAAAAELMDALRDDIR